MFLLLNIIAFILAVPLLVVAGVVMGHFAMWLIDKFDY